MSDQRTERLYAKLLYYYTLSRPGKRAFMKWRTVAKLLDLKSTDRNKVFRFMRHAPEGLSVSFKDTGVELVMLDEITEEAIVVAKIFDHWRQKTSRTHMTKLSDQRASLIRKRLREGYTPDQLMLAIEGILLSPYHCGDNKHGTKYLELSNAIGSPERVEKWIAMMDQSDIAAIAERATLRRRNRNRR